MKNILVLIMIFLVLACKHNKALPEPKDNIIKTGVDTLVVYNDILNDLLENRLYYRYLGRKWELLYIDFVNKRIDSTTYSMRLDTLRDNVIENDSLKGVLYIDGVFEGFRKEVKPPSFVKKYGFDFNEVNTQIKKKNFININSLKSNLVEIIRLPKPNSNNQKNKYEVGSINFSKIVFDKSKLSGILYFSFKCGGKCGEGSLALIKKEADNWKVIEIHELWNI